MDYSTRGVYGMFGFGSKENPLSLKNMKYQKRRFNEELQNLPEVDSDRLFRDNLLEKGKQDK